MAKDKKTSYFKVQVRRPLTSEEKAYIDSLPEEHKRWEIDRQTVLFALAVRATSEKDAVKRVRKMLDDVMIERVETQ